MPLYMDIHHLDGGVATEDVAKAHLADLEKGRPRRHEPAVLGG